MRKTINIGAKVGFLDKGKYKWSKVLSFQNDEVVLEQINKYKTQFSMNIHVVLHYYEQKVVKIITNTKKY